MLKAFSLLDKSFTYSKKENIKFIRDNMALPFTHHSRLGFVYFAQLNNLLRKEVITEAHKNSLLLSVKSISTKMKSDAYQVKIGKQSLNSFLDVYGHIRPGNYNLSSSNLKNNLEFTELLVQNSENQDENIPLEKIIFSNIDKYFKLNNIPYTASARVEMFQTAIGTRQKTKF